MNRRFEFAALLLSALFAPLAGCGGGLEEFPVAETTGTVTCDGAPVQYALVFFEPLKTGGSAVVGKQGVAVTDENGRFSISTYGEKDGAVVGQHRVRVGAPERAGWSCNCETNSEVDLMQVSISDGGENSFELELPPQKRRRRGEASSVDPDEDNDE